MNTYVRSLSGRIYQFLYNSRDGLLRWHQKHNVAVAGVGHPCVWLHNESADLDLEGVNSKRRLHTFEFLL
jgi:hypothetical protein